MGRKKGKKEGIKEEWDREEGGREEIHKSR